MYKQLKDETWYEESDILNIHNPTNYQSNFTLKLFIPVTVTFSWF
jgi:hypothetical protein